ncbi:hypothetical protein SEPCBS57363_006692 [Sporothrix epigloea]|uniref:Zinc metallopeptidase n=1 Tax=Sporothrix epigloea TaxID=1892477 RepID=A0ABP0E5Q7_9PEZI
MPEHNAVFSTYSHLRHLPRADNALQILRRVASLVKPLVRARQWKVRELAEFYPEQANLLGLNINRGQKILLRLRYPGGENSLFLPLDQIADTLLHELAHIVHGPHDANFQALWDQLRDEHMALALKGFTGEAFLSDGRRLGNGSGSKSGYLASNSLDETRRLARAAAERRHNEARVAEAVERQRKRNQREYTGHVLGGGSSSRGHSEIQRDIRQVVADAVARRNQHTPETLRGCATDGPQYNDRTRALLADQASRNGFRTQAEEDAANDAAIAQALWELVQEGEKKRLGNRYVPPTAGLLDNSNRIGSRLSPVVLDDSPSQQRRLSSIAPPGPPPARVKRSSISVSTPEPSHARPSRGWTCTICTLHNPSTYLVCDACGVEKPLSPKDRDASHRKSRSDVASTQTLQQLSDSQPLLYREQPPPAPPSRHLHGAVTPNSTVTLVSRVSTRPNTQQALLSKKTAPTKKVHFTPSTFGGSV